MRKPVKAIAKPVKAIVTLEHRFCEYGGVLYTSGAFQNDFWKRYLDIFDSVLIVARVKTLDQLEDHLIPVDGDGIDFYPLPYYVGLKQGLLNMTKTRKSLDELVRQHRGAYILRVGSPIADILGPMLGQRGIEYAVEVVGDPWDVFAPGAISHPLRPILRRYFARKLKEQCSSAKFSSYVTEFALQKRYPPSNSLFTEHASSITLDEEYFYRRDSFANLAPNWVFVGTLEQMQKAPDVLLKAFRIVVESFPQAKLTLVGDGRERAALEALAQKLGINQNVVFNGHLSSPELVREKLIENPYFVLPSRGEGLPRAMIEAMACGCLCVGSDIGGIRELIDARWIAPVGSHTVLAQKMISAMLLDERDKRNVSFENNENAKKYLSEKLERRRQGFYTKIKARLEELL